MEFFYNTRKEENIKNELKLKLLPVKISQQYIDRYLEHGIQMLEQNIVLGNPRTAALLEYSDHLP